MSATVVISVLLRIVAAVWSVAVMWRLRDYRVLFLTVMLALMAARQALTLAAGFSLGSEIALDINAQLHEVPGLIVSLMAFLVVLNLEGFVRRDHQRSRWSPGEPVGGIPILFVLAVGLTSIVATFAVSIFAYESSRSAIRKTVADGNLMLCQSVCAAVMEDFQDRTDFEKQDVLDHLRHVWDRTQARDQNTYLCVVSPEGKLDLHTLDPRSQGIAVGQQVVSERSGETILQLLRSHRDWSGQNDSYRGVRQIVGYHYLPAIDSLVAVHVPVKAVDRGFAAAAAPWIGSMTLVGGLLLPCAIGLLYHSSQQATKRALASLAALRDSEERYRRLVKNSPFCVHEIEPSGEFSLINPAGRRMLGLSEEAELCGIDCLTAVCERDKPRVRQLLEESLGGQVRQFEFDTPDNRTFRSSFVPLHDGDGALLRIMGISEDVTAQKQAEKALHESESLFRTIFDQAAVGVAQLDSVTGVIVRANTKYCEILNASSESLVGRTWMELTHPDDLKRDLARMERLRAGDIREFAIEKRLQRTDGSFVDINLTVSPMWRPGESPTTHIAIVEDITERKRHEEQYRSIVETTQEWIWEINLAGQHTFSNPAVEKLLGYTAEEIVGRDALALLHEVDREVVARELPRIVAERRGWTGWVLRWRHKDGNVRHLESNAVPILDAEGLVCGYRGADRDITDRLKAEAAVRESERSLAEAQRIAQVGSWELDFTTWVVAGSAEMRRILGVPESESLPSIEAFFSDFVLKEDVPAVAHAFQQAKDRGIDDPIDFRIRQKPDGRLRFVRVAAEIIKDHSGTPKRINGTLQDITEQKQVELALRASEDKFRRLTEESPATVFIAKRDSFVYCNPMFETVSGYSREDVFQMRIRDIVHPDNYELVADRHSRRLRGEKVPSRYEVKFVTKSGAECWIDLSAQLIEFEDEPAVLITGVNVTERKAAEAALRQSEEALRELNASLELRVAERTAELEEINEELEAFARTISHDLRSPLRAIEGFAVALTEDCAEQLDKCGREYVQHILDSAQRMDGLAADLLAYSRLSHREIRIATVELDSILKAAVNQLDADISACHAELHIAEHLPKVRAHAPTLLLAVSNLLSNSMKFVAPGVRPEIRIGTERRADGMIRLCIEDNGIGIDKSAQERIFKVFERLHGIESYPGTGIGLAVVSRACERLGAAYGVYSEPGQGSRFWIDLKPDGD